MNNLRCFLLFDNGTNSNGKKCIMEVNLIKKKCLNGTYRLTYDDYEYLVKKYGAITILDVLTFEVKDVLVQ